MPYMRHLQRVKYAELLQIAGRQKRSQKLIVVKMVFMINCFGKTFSFLQCIIKTRGYIEKCKENAA